jgi:hypothetical protein
MDAAVRLKSNLIVLVIETERVDMCQGRMALGAFSLRGPALREADHNRTSQQYGFREQRPE